MCKNAKCQRQWCSRQLFQGLVIVQCALEHRDPFGNIFGHQQAGAIGNDFIPACNKRIDEWSIKRGQLIVSEAGQRCQQVGVRVPACDHETIIGIACNETAQGR